MTKYSEAITVKEFVNKIKSGEAKVLTVKRAKKLKGQKILWMYFGYSGNINTVREMIVGEIISELSYYENQPCEGYKSRAEYWRSYMNPDQLQDNRDKLLLLDEDGSESYICAHTGRFNFFEVPTFTCSDADREVYYLCVNEN